jgi:uroporphyrinogen-III synthase
LERGLAARGAIVERVVAYDPIPEGDPAQLEALLPAVDIVALTSSSTVQNLVNLLGPEAEARTRGVTLASIGPITTQMARDLGLRVQIEASEHTIPGLVAALDAGPNPPGGHPWLLA